VSLRGVDWAGGRERGPRLALQLKLAGDAEFRLVVIDQLLQFMGTTTAVIFVEPLQLHL
jgi:hypothetical protein